ncbi:hypothetical protein PENPOL_c019G05391 [Penicillium polonicum]
MGVLV